MPWKLHDKEYAKVLAMPPPERYTYMLGKLGDWRELYSLKNREGWVLVGDDDGREGVPDLAASEVRTGLRDGRLG